MGVKYRYAMIEDGSIIDVRDLDDSNRRQDFLCISCGTPLKPRLGPERAYHFAHNEKGSCSVETYLHIAAEMIIKSRFDWCIENEAPFLIEAIKNIINCIGCEKKCSWNFYKTYDLIKYFNQCIVEISDNGFRPDILLKGIERDKKLYIEICCTHKVTEDKLESKIPMIEINIESESDLVLLSNKYHTLSQKDRKVTFHNFKYAEKEIDVSERCCRARAFRHTILINRISRGWVKSFYELTRKDLELSTPCGESYELHVKHIKSLFLGRPDIKEIYPGATLDDDDIDMNKIFKELVI